MPDDDKGLAVVEPVRAAATMILDPVVQMSQTRAVRRDSKAS